MSTLPTLQLRWLGHAALARALRDVGAPHLPLTQLSDHYVTANAALRDAVERKIARLLAALAPRFETGAQGGWPAVPADVLALDLAFVASATAPFALAWVEVQAFTSMLPTFHTLQLAQRRVHGLPARWLPHAPVPDGGGWANHLRHWVAPDTATVLIDDHPRQSASWPDFAAARHWWGVDVRDWRGLDFAADGVRDTASGRTYRHVWNRLILSDLDSAERAAAATRMKQATRVGWHSHPAWYARIDKGSLADVALEPHEACHWVEACPDGARGWSEPARWVAKAAGGHSGSGLLLTPSAAQLAALPRPRQWIVQRRFRQVPIGCHAITGTPLYGELRCMVGLRPGMPPWLMASILRLSTDGIATLSGRVTAPGEGMTLLYFDQGA